MEKEFIPYELALELKNLGFNEDCLKCYSPNPNINVPIDKEFILVNTDTYLPKQTETIGDLIKNGLFTKSILAPLWQQAFDWFREKYNKVSYVSQWSDTKEYYYSIYHEDEVLNYNPVFNSYEEARQACLEKLIETIKIDKL